MKNAAKITTLCLLALASAPMIVACAAVEGRQSVAQNIDDAATSTSVRTSIISDKDLKLRQIDVETMNGVVQLSGFVDSAAEKAEAQRIAANTSGVRSVKNNLVIRPVR